MSVKTRLTTKVQPELQRGRIMPQICHFIGVNSVTNIEPPKGFVPVLNCIFADWFENFDADAVLVHQRPGLRRIWVEGRSAIWPFALSLKPSGSLPIC
ncbi:hypothetical protein E4O97_16930 [Pseudomonas sp. W15Feb34]|uniref:Uncharacterized protein n=1 Tax=Pseudomonas synxantha TaxID=47883 RepID=A0A5D3GAQ0_9PSED|nr:hypothetical protein [Pseudomonas fluorescens]MCK3845095.1 hypothetical protein [Pseudomonas sp. W15Feb34]TYK56878.1 hypothetical protein FXO26_17795 [Pseudomonas synxantha]